MKTVAAVLALGMLAGCNVTYRPPEGGYTPRSGSGAPSPAPSRSAGPPEVAIFKVTTPEGIDGAKILEQLRRDFGGDSRFRLMDARTVEKEEKRRSKGGRNDFAYSPEIEIQVDVTIRKEAGYDRNTKKMVEVGVFVMTGRIEWRAAGRTRKVEESGHWLKNQEVANKFSAKLRDEASR